MKNNVCERCVHNDVCYLHEDNFMEDAAKNGFCGKFRDVDAEIRELIKTLKKKEEKKKWSNRAKRFACALLVFFLTLLLCGCSGSTYPYLDYKHCYWQADSWNSANCHQRISLPDGYRPNQGHLYDMKETEDGYSITLYFVKEDAEK